MTSEIERGLRAVLSEVHFQSDRKEIAHPENTKFLDRRARELVPVFLKAMKQPISSAGTLATQDLPITTAVNVEQTLNWEPGTGKRKEREL